MTRSPGRASLLELARRVLLLVGVARDEPAEPAVRHVDEAGAVDPVLAHAAPEVRRAEVGVRLLERLAVACRPAASRSGSPPSAASAIQPG